MNPLLVPVPKAARLLSVSAKKLRSLIASGKVKSVQLGGRQMVATAELKRIASGKGSQDAETLRRWLRTA